MQDGVRESCYTETLIWKLKEILKNVFFINLNQKVFWTLHQKNTIFPNFFRKQLFSQLNDIFFDSVIQYYEMNH